MNLYSCLSCNSLFMQNNSRLLCLSVSECWQLSDSEPFMQGEVQSPQYPQPYPPKLRKEWDLWVPEGYQIQLSLTHLDIKASAGCYQDSLTVTTILKSNILHQPYYHHYSVASVHIPLDANSKNALKNFLPGYL